MIQQISIVNIGNVLYQPIGRIYVYECFLDQELISYRSLLILFFLGRPSSKSLLRLRRFKLDRDESWQEKLKLAPKSFFK